MNLNLKHDGFERAGRINVPEHLSQRLVTGDANLDAIFGGGIQAGSCIIVHAGAGVGKTSFCLDLCQKLDRVGYDVKYSSGEESKTQLSATANRIKSSNVQLGNITDVDELAELTETNDLLVIDSFQTLTSTNKKITKFKMIDYALDKLISRAKKNGCALLFIFQENGGGKMSGGPKMAFALDTHINIEKDGKIESGRLFFVIKNRCGETGVFGANLFNDGYHYTGLKQHIKMEKKSNNVLADIGIEIGALILENAVKGTKYSGFSRASMALRRLKRYV